MISKVVEFCPGHLDLFEPREEEDDQREGILLGYQLNNVELFSIICDNKVLGIVGANHMRQGTAEVWICISKHISKYAKTFHKTVLDLIEWGVKKHNKYRLTIAVRVDSDRNYKWAEAIGFKAEGIMKKYDGKKDFYLMARLF